MASSFTLSCKYLLFIFVWLGVGSVVFNGVASCNTPEYQAGQSLGYTEHNESKYEAALVLGDFITPPCTEEQGNYAKGYIAGYEDYQREFMYEEYRKIEVEKVNNSIEILGV